MNGIAILATCLLMIRDENVLLASRLIQGCCIGFYSVFVPLLIREFSPVEIYGSLGTSNQLFITMGILSAYAINQYDSAHPENNITAFWILIFEFPLLLLVLQTVLLLTVFKDETPNYLLLKGKNSECHALLAKIYEE